ncbi:hypothetical protein [Massilia glaciei]|uniref:DUF4124 domain-containing protein n=1 Tax=Massilia glaciei TaxID=1524097 RepID=A0A2U2I6G4_9BURK|nr:hypothetical protein [Massilia glaciei]PWF55275.1 hypothetical protein C7C56_002600 [Massilia glaciei]
MRTHPMRARRRQAGLGLVQVAVISALVAGVGMCAMMSMRADRNFFAEGWAKLSGSAGARAGDLLDQGRRAANGDDGLLRKCVIKGRTVVSNEDCKPDNRTSKVIRTSETRGFVTPKAVAPAPEAPTSMPEVDKMIEKQLR